MKYLSPEWRDKLLAAGFPAADLCTGEAEEILERLPKTLKPFHQHGRLTVQFSKDMYYPLVGYIEFPSNDWIFRGENYQDGMMYFTEDTLADTCAAIYVYLAENGLLPKA